MDDRLDWNAIRDRLGVVTRALFAQRDFSDMSILEEFQTSLELSLRSKLTESGLYMGECFLFVLPSHIARWSGAELTFDGYHLSGTRL